MVRKFGLEFCRLVFCCVENICWDRDDIEIVIRDLVLLRDLLFEMD